VSEFGGTQWMSLPAICKLASKRQWVCWKHQKRKGKLTKVPYQPDGKPASPTNPKTWNEMPTCYAAVVAGKFDGIGYVLTQDDGLACVDLDHCSNEDGTLKPWAAKIVKDLDSYTERSPGGDGLHVWVIAHVSFSGRRHKGVEIYASGRYMTVTAEHWTGSPEELHDRTDVLEKIVADFPSSAPLALVKDQTFTIDSNADVPGLKFHALIENEKRFKASWDHTRKDLGDDSLSSYDMSLATLAAYAEWTDQEIVNLIIAHRRKQGNPEKGLRSDYLKRTLARAHQATNVSLKDYEAAEVHRVGETREVSTEDGLERLSALLAIQVTRVVQRGHDPAFYTIETDRGEIHIGSADILLAANKARAKMIATSEIYLPKMTAKDWEKVVALLIQVHEYEEIAEGQRDQEIFTWIDAYLTEKPAEVPEDAAALATALKIGSWPIEWEGKIQVRSRDVKRYIFATMGEKPSTSVICTRFREAGWTPAQLQARVQQNILKARVWVKEISEMG